MVSRRRYRRRAVFAAIVASLVVLGLDLTVRSLADGPDRRAAYLDEARPHVEDSTQQGLDLLELRREGATLERRVFDQRLAELVTATTVTLEAVVELEPPDSLVEADALLVSTLALRADAARDLQAALTALLDGGPVDDARSTVGAAVADLGVADRTFVAFSERTQETEVDAGVPPSSWVTDVDGWDAPSLDAWLVQLRTSPGLAAITDVGIVTTSIEPAPVATEGEVEVLATDEELTVTLVVANQGSTSLEEVPVTARLDIEGTPGQEVTEAVALSPGQNLTVALTGLVPTVGRPAVLTVTVGPVSGETVAADNTKVVRLRVRSPDEQATTTTTAPPPPTTAVDPSTTTSTPPATGSPAVPDGAA